MLLNHKIEKVSMCQHWWVKGVFEVCDIETLETFFIYGM